MRRTRIVGTGAYLPERILRNQDLEQMVDTSDAWIVERTGIRERRLASEKEATSDLGAEAARRALEAAGVAPQDLDFIIVATATPDMLFPSTACLVQERLGAHRAFAFDLSAACSGFLYALTVGDQFLRSGEYHLGVIVGAEVLSRFVDWTDRTTCVLFGDGAGAVVIRAEEGERGILASRLHADGRLWDLLCIPGGGSRMPPSETVLRDRLAFVRMRGNETFRVAVQTLTEVVEEILQAAGLEPGAVDWLIPHQANRRILQAVARRLGIPEERVVINLDRYGNTSAASIPVALDEGVRTGRIRPGDLILMEAFGAGLTWGAMLLRW